MEKTKLKKTMLVTSIVLALLLAGTLVSSSVIAIGENENQASPLSGEPLFERIRNRICDMLGICLGGCELETLTGTLDYDGEEFFIGDVELHFGPDWYIEGAISAEDYDGDGDYELVIDELLGLVGTEVTVEGHYQTSDSWMSVFTINGLVYREPGQPIWAAQHHWRWRHRNNDE